MALAIEAAELMEHFQWITTEASRTLADDALRRDEVAEELSDVICYALAMANAMGIDVSRSLTAKMAKNAVKYPASEFRGRFGHDDPRRISD
jgi:dCTP diphosphatase